MLSLILWALMWMCLQRISTKIVVGVWWPHQVNFVGEREYRHLRQISPECHGLNDLRVLLILHLKWHVPAVQKCAQHGYREKWWWIATARQQVEICDKKWEILKSGIIFECVTKHMANAIDDINACVTLHDMDVNDNIHDSVAPHDAFTIIHIHWTWVRLVLFSV